MFTFIMAIFFLIILLVLLILSWLSNGIRKGFHNFQKTFNHSNKKGHDNTSGKGSITKTLDDIQRKMYKKYKGEYIDYEEIDENAANN